MTSLAQRRDKVQAALEEAQKGPLKRAIEFLSERGHDAALLWEKLRTTGHLQVLNPELRELAAAFSSVVPREIERAMLVRAATLTLPHILPLAVDDSVKHLLYKEFLMYAKPPAGTDDRFLITGYPFLEMSKIVTLQRYPAGQLHWEISGMPGRYIARARLAQLPSTLWFLLTRMRGRDPYFVFHVGGTVLRLPMLSKREFLKSFCRVALAVEMQPSICGVMAGSWLHSRETHRVSPHLSFLNEPYEECGGHYFDSGPAGEKDGFLNGDERRAELYRSGQYKPTFGVVMCSRNQLISWVRKHREVVDALAVR